MKTKKISWQAIAIVALALVLIAAIALGVSGAWFQDRDEAGTNATLGHAVEVKLQNVDDANATADGIKGWKELYDSTKTNAYPGDVIIGKTQIKMGSDTPAIIRAKITPIVIKKGETDPMVFGEITLETIGGVAAPTDLTDANAEAVKKYYNALIASKPSPSLYGTGKGEEFTTEKYEAALTAYTTNADKWNAFLLKNMTETIKLDDAKWTAASTAGYRYYTTVWGRTDAASKGALTDLNNGVIELFDKATLSEYLTNEVAQWQIKVNLEVEAIQAANIQDNATWYGDMTTDIKDAANRYNENTARKEA